MAKKRPKPATETIQPAVGPNLEGLSAQALVAQRRTADKRKGDTDVEFAPDPAATDRRRAVRARKSAKAVRPARKRTPSASPDEGAQREGGN